MGKIIKEIIIEDIQKENIYPNEYIRKKIEHLGKQPIRKSKLLNKNLNKKLLEKNINLTEEFFSLTIEEANSIFRISRTITRNYVKSLSNKLIKAFKNSKTNQLSKNKAVLTHPKLEKLITLIKESPLLSQYLKEDMIHREKINDLDNIEYITARKFINSRLNLSNEELALLRRYLLNEILLEELETSNNKSKYYDQIVNIYGELKYYTRKIEYKEILKQNYDSIDEIGLTPAEKNTLKRNHITKIGDIIEFSEKEILGIPNIGKMICAKILVFIEEKNIILLTDKERLINVLNYDNANILPIKEIKNQK